MRMESSKIALLVLLLTGYALLVSVNGHKDAESRRERGREEMERKEKFLLQRSRELVKTEAGVMKVVRGHGGGRMAGAPMHVGFISMEPSSLFVPQYLDSTLILFIQRGEARLAYVYKDELAEKRLRSGDVYRIPAGSAFYLVNTDENQKLDVICSIDTSESLRMNSYESFFIGGGTYPTSVLAGFETETLSAALNVSSSELREIMTRQQSGPIVHLSDSRSPSMWAKFLDLEQHHRLAHLKRIVRIEEEEEEGSSEEDEGSTWSLRKLLISVLGSKNDRRDERGSAAPDSYNLYDRQPDFKNNYGWSLALDESEYSPLGDSDIGVYLVNLNEGSMMAPHINPTATEYGIVLRGSGTIQIVYPNGTLATNTKVREGDVFWVPRYFPFCQIASRSSSFEFFGFTTSARKNKPQFLVGANSLLEAMRGPEIAAAFGLREERLREIIEAQHESVILPPTVRAEPKEMTIVEKVTGKGIAMIMGS